MYSPYVQAHLWTSFRIARLDKADDVSENWAGAGEPYLA